MNSAVALGVSWLVLIFLFAGVGILCAPRRVLRTSGDLGSDSSISILWVAPLIGLLVFIVMLQIWYLFLPITWVPFALLTVVGCTGLIIHLREMASLFSRIQINRNRFVAVSLGLLLAITWIALSASVRPTMPDFYGYELSVIQWAQSSRALPGIANFEERLGFGSALWLLAASLDIGPWSGYGYLLPNGLIVSMFFVQVGMSWLSRSGPSGAAYRSFLAISAVVVLVRASINPDWWLAAPQPDLPVLVLVLSSAALVLLFFESCHSRIIQAALLVAVLAVLVRLTASPWLLGVGLLAVATSIQHIRHRGLRYVWFKWRFSILLLALSLMPYFATRYLLTGYQFYPVTRPAIGNPDWRIDDSRSAETIKWFFARNLNITQEQIDDGTWIQVFLRYLVTSDTAVQGTLLMVALAGILLLISGSVRQLKLIRADFGGLYIVATAIFGLGLWIWTSKQERFAWPYLVLLGMIPLTLVLTKVRIRASTLVISALSVTVLGLLVLLFAPWFQRALDINARGKPMSLGVQLWSRGAGPFGVPELPSVTYQEVTNSSGLTFSVPIDGGSEIGGPGTTGGYCGRGLPECSFDLLLDVERRTESALGGFRRYDGAT